MVLEEFGHLNCFFINSTSLLLDKESSPVLQSRYFNKFQNVANRRFADLRKSNFTFLLKL